MLLDPASVYQATRLSDASAQRRLVVRAAQIAKSWPELSAARQRALLTTLIERIDVGADRMDIHFRPTWLRAFFDVAAMRLPSGTDDENSGPVHPGTAAPRLARDHNADRWGRPVRRSQTRRAADQAADQGAQLPRRTHRQRRVPFAALAKREGVSPFYFTRLVRLSYLMQAILDGSHLGDTAVLEYRPTETLPLLRAMLLDLARLCRPRRSPQPEHPWETAASRRRKANSRERQVRT